MDKYLLCCDWGTSSFRLRLVNTEDYSVIEDIQSKDGISLVFDAWKSSDANRQDFFIGKLDNYVRELAAKTILDIATIPLIISGMASSSIGMEEVPYAALPFSVNGSTAAIKKFKTTNNFTHSITLVSGVKSAEDVMRGEEAQLIGLFHLNEISLPETHEIIFVFPGTHSKHIHVMKDQLVDFHTYMTGEIFNLMASQSILKDSISLSGDTDLSSEAAGEAFRSGVRASGSSSILHSLFTVRTNQLFNKFAKDQNSLYLSGLLIGTELRALNGISAQVVICSGSHLYDHYKIAAETIGLNALFIPSSLIDKATIAGQVQIFKNSTHA